MSLRKSDAVQGFPSVETTMTMRNLWSSSGAGATTTSLRSGGSATTRSSWQAPRRSGGDDSGDSGWRRCRGGTGSTTATRGVEKVPGLAAPALAGGLARPRGTERRAQWGGAEGGARGASVPPRGTAAREKYPSKAGRSCERLEAWRRGGRAREARGRAPGGAGQGIARDAARLGTSRRGRGHAGQEKSRGRRGRRRGRVEERERGPQGEARGGRGEGGRGDRRVNNTKSLTTH